MIEAYIIHLLVLIGIYLISAIALQVTFGYTGLVNLGHIALFAIGAYVSALLTLNGMPFIVAIFLSGLIAGLFGYLLSILTNKLNGDYFALSTLAFTFVVYSILLNWTSLTRGPLGLVGIPKPVIFNFSFSSNFNFLLLVSFFVLLTIIVVKRLIDSPFGRVLEATRDNEPATQVLGKDTYRIKSIALTFSAFLAGIAGSLYVHYITYIEPSSFTLMQLIPILSIVIVGGLASIKGTILATFILLLIPELIRFIGFSSSILGPMRQIVYGLLLLLILLYMPKGFFGKVELG
jgi:branched-chain amino acid transport system permease protein